MNIFSSRRWNWMVQLIQDSLSVNKKNTGMIEDLKQKYSEVIKTFLDGKGPARLLIYNQHQNESSMEDRDGLESQVFVTAGDSEPIKGKAVAFIRVTPQDKPVNLQEQDGDVVFMEISPNTLDQLSLTMNQIFVGMIENLQPEEWKECDKEQVEEFKTLASKFADDLKTGCDNLKTTQEQCKINKAEWDVKEGDQRKVAEALLTQWLAYFKDKMKEKDENKSSNNNEGPDTELNYWKTRLQDITMLHQLSLSADFKKVINTLGGGKNVADLAGKKDEGSNKLNAWKEVNTELTEHLNQAKDNVKYLSTLEKFIEPLKTGEPKDIIESLPALMNAIKMIHTIARYYNTSNKLTNLFVKITNQMILNCKKYIGDKPPEKIWDMDPSTLIEKLNACVTLCQKYKTIYETTKAKAAELPKARHWDFDDNVIFGRFDTFIKRVKKLTEIFNTILQFRALEKHNNLESMDELTSTFFKRIKEFQAKGHALLESDKVAFDKDYVELIQDIQKMDTKLQSFIHSHFGRFKNISYSLRLLKKFESILKRDNIKNVLANRYEAILQNYGSEIEGILKLFDENKPSPVVIRNMPSDAGKIIWVRHLYSRLRGPMDEFPPNLSTKEIMKKYTQKFNYFARNLLIYEIYFTQSWCNDIDKAKGALQNVLIVMKEENGVKRMRVNFENDIKKLIREAKALDREGIGGIPESAKIILLQEEKFKKYYYELDFIKSEYERILSKIKPIMRNILHTHILDLEVKLRPGMVTLTWTSMNIDGFLESAQQGLHKLEQLIITINDIIENRIENNLKQISKVLLVHLPEDGKPMSLERFVDIQHSNIKEKTVLLISKNIEIERAVNDLLYAINTYPVDPHIGPVEGNATKNIKRYYFWYLYQALLTSTQNSLNAMKNRVCGKRGGSEEKSGLKPFFEVDVKLEAGKVTLDPDLKEIQKHINRAATAVLSCSKKLLRWRDIDKDSSGNGDEPSAETDNLYKIIAQDKEIVKVILLLTGSIQGTKNQVKQFKVGFKKYDWLWKQNIKKTLEEFSKKNPQLQDFEDELKKFAETNSQIDQIHRTREIGAMALKTDKLIGGLKERVKDWKESYAEDLHQKAKSQLFGITENNKNLITKLRKDVIDIDSLGHVMETLEEIKKEQAEIDLKFDPVLEMYTLLDQYLQGGITDKDELDNRLTLKRKWNEVIVLAEEKQRVLQSEQARHLSALRSHVKQFSVDVKEFRKNFDEKGPKVPGIGPNEASDRLSQFSKEFELKMNYFNTYRRGENLFGLQNKEYVELQDTEKEIANLDKLYSLYKIVLETTATWEDLAWADVTSSDLRDWEDKVMMYSEQCTKLPRDLRTWEAYNTLKNRIEAYKKVLPMIRELKEPCVKERHWERLCETTKKELNYKQPENFHFGKILEANLLDFEEDVSDIIDAAKKQEKYEKQKTEIIESWESATFEFKNMNRGVPCLLEGNVVESLREKLDEDIATLSGLSAMKQIGPFKEEVTKWQLDLTDVQNTMNQWVKIQLAWQSLESVFTTGDITKTLAAEASRFKKTDKLWIKTVMEKAAETKKVVKSCQDDVIKATLPTIQEDLDICQKQLDRYLEQKRKMFARFYFVSEGVLLKFLSMGSEPEAVQEDFDKLFEAITKVKFERADKKSNDKKITEIMTVFKGEVEKIDLEQHVVCKNSIEIWLNELTKAMQQAVRMVIKSASIALFQTNMPFDEFISGKFCAQVCLLGMQLKWTKMLQDALEKKSLTEKNKAMAEVKKEMDKIVEILGAKSKDKNLESKKDRQNIETLMTVAVYLQGVTNKPYKDINDFEWTKLTRVYFKENDHCYVQITDWEAIYSYEYMGIKDRLCITTLTDRCYITLAQAMSMHYGGAPAGPAGTGKTETVKDLGRTLGIFVVVTNCSPEQRYTDMAKIFKGLCQSGLWGCFDEFNRIDLEVLSVVAMQVESITRAKKTFNCKQFEFPDEPIPIILIPTCSYFITMNPGYAGRQELPENLKAQFRGVTMMVPDSVAIIKTKLASCGYKEFDYLSKKFGTLYALCNEQLSKQKHYDWGLRNILSVLRTAGKTLRDMENIGNTDKERKMNEEMLMMLTLRDMNLAGFVSDDVPLFKALLKDIFPLITNLKDKDMKNEAQKIIERITANGLENEKSWTLKIFQVYEKSLVRHGFMLLGPTGVGKSSILNVLTEALSEFFMKTQIIRLNPKAFTSQEMYGVRNQLGEWTTGIFSEIWAMANSKKANKPNYWITCDGPVDAIWIENLNTVLDDNKVLTLANGERIFMTETCKMVFEVENLANASPATVSRCGQIYVSPDDLSQESLITAWVKQRDKNEKLGRQDVDKIFASSEAKIILAILLRWFVKDKVIEVVEKISLKNPVMYLDSSLRLFQTLNILGGVLLPSSKAAASRQYSETDFEKIILYSLFWGVGGIMQPKERGDFQEWLKEKNAALPKIREGETIYDYILDFDNSQNIDWKSIEPAPWKPPSGVFNFSQLLLPTIDSLRAEILINFIAKQTKNPICYKTVLLIGEQGTAKTASVLMYASKFNRDQMLFSRINFSSATQPHHFQQSIESMCEGKVGKGFGPKDNKQMTVFIDDFSMPELNLWGDQITLEIVRQLMEEGGFYRLEKNERGQFKYIYNLQYIAAMNHPVGGRNDIPNRLKRLLFIFNMTLPTRVDIIYGPILRHHFKAKEIGDAVKVIDQVPQATVRLWTKVKNNFNATPAKFHYVFNMRDLSRIFKGMTEIKIDHLKTCQKECGLRPDLYIIALWKHECERVFADKLIENREKDIVLNFITETACDSFMGLDTEIKEKLSKDRQLFFFNFMEEDKYNEDGLVEEEAPREYKASLNIEKIRTRCESLLKVFNATPKYSNRKMDLVLFDDALKHLLRIARIIMMSRSSALLVGVGGSGKQSLTRLASFANKYEMFQITLTKGYGEAALKEDLKGSFDIAGHKGQSISFILTDAEIKSESFLEYINMVLSTGEVPGLIPKDEREIWLGDVRTEFVKLFKNIKEPDNNMIYDYFLNRLRDKLHFALCFSPEGNKFRERARKFPALFNECTIDWFLEWPNEALVSVASQMITSFPKLQTTEENKVELSKHMATVHSQVTKMCKTYYQKMRRQVWVTPKSYLSFLKAFKKLYEIKYDNLDEAANNYRVGLEKISGAAEGVHKLEEELSKEEKKLLITQEKTQELLEEISESRAKSMKKNSEVTATKKVLEVEKAEITKEAEECSKMLKESEHLLKQAQQSANLITVQDLAPLRALAPDKTHIMMRYVVDVMCLIFYQRVNNQLAVGEKLVNRGQNISVNFWQDSFKEYGKAAFSDPDLLTKLKLMAQEETNTMNEEILELIEPYLVLNNHWFNGENAKNAAGCIQAVYNWAAGMMSFTQETQKVIPKRQALKVSQMKLEKAEMELAQAEATLKELDQKLQVLDDQFKEKNAEMTAIQESAKLQKKRIEAAKRLLSSLSEEKDRWEIGASMIKKDKNELVGNVSLATAFVSYCGPFNAEFRSQLAKHNFLEDLRKRKIPVKPTIFPEELTSFLVDDAEVSQWNLEGLPKDELSIQNGIMVTSSDRFPLLIDPQGQGSSWIKNRYASYIIPPYSVVGITEDKKLKDGLNHCLENGLTFIIENVEGEVDPTLDPVLEKQYTQRKVNGPKKIKLGGVDLDWDDEFRMFLTSRMSNPIFSPELCAKTTIIDFTVTQYGLEQQLLSAVLSKELRAVEDQLNSLIREVTDNKKQLKLLDKLLLDKLTSATGNLIEDQGLIEILNNTKTQSKEVAVKLKEAEIKTKEIGEKRDQYKPVSIRGSVLYFSMIDIAQVDWMYNSSLNQFMEIYNTSIDKATPATLPTKRVANIRSELTMRAFRYVSRGLFERHKMTYLILICFGILITDKKLTSNDISLFLKMGGGSDVKVSKPKPNHSYISEDTWMNILALSQHKFGSESSESVPFFKNLPEQISSNTDWNKNFIDQPNPEEQLIPEYQDKISSNKEIGHFLKLCLIRALREGRTNIAAKSFISVTLEDEQYTKPYTDTIESIWQETTPRVPVLYLLSAGADPSSSIDDLAKAQKRPIYKVSMGEGQEKKAEALIKEGMEKGSWVLMQNCHLGLGFMQQLDTMLTDPESMAKSDPEFRMWMSCEPREGFPLGLLQKSLKVTNEPPIGLKAGILKTFKTMVTPEYLEKIEHQHWRTLVYSISFMHSLVIERKKFGPLGFCVPYEFNNSDLEASLSFVEKYLNQIQTNNPEKITATAFQVAYEVIIYMVCDIQYGGRIFDNLDRRLFRTYGELYFKESLTTPEFTFNSEKVHLDGGNQVNYIVPQGTDHKFYVDYIQNLPAIDNPIVFGLNNNADTTYRLIETQKMLNTIMDTRPKESGGDEDASLEDQVKEIAKKYREQLPQDYNQFEVRKSISVLQGGRGYPDRGREVPLNVFLLQEIERVQKVITLVRKTLNDIVDAADGGIIMTPDIVKSIESISIGKVPHIWMYDRAGVEISWLIPKFSEWFNSLLLRNNQLSSWMKGERPKSFWLGGFLNPNGFLTATKQEVARYTKIVKLKENKEKGAEWSLENVEFETKPADENRMKQNEQKMDYIVYINGLIMEGAKLEKDVLKDITEKGEMTYNLPLLEVTAKPASPKKDDPTDKGQSKEYECPVYKYGKRTDKYFIFNVYLQMYSAGESNKWIRRGVALLCFRQTND